MAGAAIRPIIPFGLDFLLPAAPALKPGAALDLYVEPAWRHRGIGSRLLAAVRKGWSVIELHLRRGSSITFTR
ncbi:GNAT family N-acetyltransferase [Micromonospora chersina]|uniref:GNAT family N-acetyltransferase n=1 Tax=Micromonospora chersina TaxID=47854 RepID=UPI0033CCF7B7